MLKLYGAETFINLLPDESLGQIVKKLNAELQGKEYEGEWSQQAEAVWHTITITNRKEMTQAKYYRRKKERRGEECQK